MRRWINENRSTIFYWAVLIVAAVIFFWVARGTQYFQLAIGILAASLTLLAALLLFELVWQLAKLVLGRGK